MSEPGMLHKMTESLFAETLRRIAEDVWKTRFTELAKLANFRYESHVQDFLRAALVDCLRDDAELRDALREAMKTALTEYLKGITKGGGE